MSNATESAAEANEIQPLVNFFLAVLTIAIIFMGFLVYCIVLFVVRKSPHLASANCFLMAMQFSQQPPEENRKRSFSIDEVAKCAQGVVPEISIDASSELPRRCSSSRSVVYAWLNSGPARCESHTETLTQRKQSLSTGLQLSSGQTSRVSLADFLVDGESAVVTLDHYVGSAPTNVSLASLASVIPRLQAKKKKLRASAKSCLLTLLFILRWLPIQQISMWLFHHSDNAKKVHEFFMLAGLYLGLAQFCFCVYSHKILKAALKDFLDEHRFNRPQCRNFVTPLAV
ncbi:hypothetical protein CAPTEDRAFT_185680 [Capitella teleta]|uniref:Uncharacterized protein n=1 Tax=Capitella teleta TaxID=283909 RepID=R7TT28_CAPTE|nr:hypothetical protein CAPTEDRAFT_185680 [Capitella teleta]|eukprot:ELT94185.1 hypothetical protein CAPTEDRAFT_185680 [Capitella teleta]